MAEPTAGTKWDGVKADREFEPLVLFVIATVCCSISGFFLCHYHIFLLFFAFFLVVLIGDELFQRCALVPPDDAAWLEFFQRYQHDIDTAIYRIIGFPPNGRHVYLYKDVRQRFYLRLLENDRRALRSFRGKTDNEARVFLFRVALSVAINITHEERLPHIPWDDPKDTSRRPNEKLADPLALNEKYLVLRKTIDDCLEQILHGHNKERNVLIFKLAVYDGLSPQEIASMPSFEIVSVHAIEQQITRIRKKLRACLEEK